MVYSLEWTITGTGALNTEYLIDVTVTGDSGSPASGVMVTCGTVPDGPPYVSNPQGYEAITDPNGKCRFTFTGQNPGADALELYVGPAGQPESYCYYLDLTWYEPIPTSIKIFVSPYIFKSPSPSSYNRVINVKVQDQKNNPVPDVSVIGGIFFGPDTGKQFSGTTNIRGIKTWRFTKTAREKDVVAACAPDYGLICYAYIR